MANLTTKIQLIDEMSDKLEKLGDASENAANRIEDLGSTAQNAFNTVEQGAQRGTTSVDGVATSLDRMHSSTENASRSAQDLGTATEKMESAASGASSSTDNLNGNIEEMIQKTDKAGDEVEEMGDKTKDAKSGMEQLAASLSSAMSALGITAAVHELTDALKDASEASAKFETSLAQLQTIAGADNMGMLSQQLLALSDNSGQASTALAETAYSAISAGQSVSDSVSAAEAASKLAAAGFTDTASALSVLTTASNSYGDSAGSLMNISDSLITTQNLGVTTVAQLAQNMGRAIATASAYNVGLDQLETAYISTTKAGIGTAESTTYISGMLNELGKSTSDVSKVIMDQTGKSFGELMNDGYSLADVLNIVYDSVGDNAEAMMNLWGSAEAGKAANAIISQGLTTFQQNLESVRNSAGATETAYETMADTTEFAHQKMQNSLQNLSSTIGGSVNPSLEKLYNEVSNVSNSVTDFLQKHPKVAAAITALTAGLIAGGAALAGIVTVTKVVIPAIMALKAAVDVASGGMTLLISGLVAAGVAVGSFAVMTEKADDPMQELTASAQAQQKELESLQAQYDSAVDKYGETSTEASRLKYQIDDLSNSMKENGGTIQDMADKTQKLIENHDQMMKSFQDSTDATHQNYVENLALITKLEDLATSTGHASGKEQAMKAIIDQLNGSVDGLNLSYEDLTKNQSQSIEKLREAAKAQAEKNQAEERAKAYVQAIQDQADYEDQLAKVKDDLTKATEQQTKAQEAYNEANKIANENSMYGGVYVAPDTSALDKANAEVQSMKDQQDQLQQKLDETNQVIKETEDAYEQAQEAAANASAAASQDAYTYQEAVALAVEDVQQQMSDLAQAYQDAYTSAEDSFNGLFGIFDEATTKSDDYKNATVGNAQKALDSQLAYWESYSANIKTLKDTSASDLGVTQQQYTALMSQLQDGSAQSAGLAASITKNLEQGNTDAVTKLAETAGKVAEQKENLAADMADWKTNFNTTMDELVSKMDKTVDDLNLSGDASSSAKKTIDSYASSIRDGGSNAVSAAESVIKQVANVFANSSTISVKDESSLIGKQVKKIQGNASGTTNADDVFIAGENGPELVVGQRGATVFPKTETDRIIDAVNKHDGEMKLSQASVTMDSPAELQNSRYSQAADVLNSLSGYEFGELDGTTAREKAANFDPERDLWISAGKALGSTKLSTPDTSVFNGSQMPGEQNDAAFSASPTVDEVNNIVDGKDAEHSLVAIDSAIPDYENSRDFGVSLRNGVSGQEQAEEERGGSSEKKITLEINGSGAIDIKGTTESEVMDILVNNVKPVLMDILRQEIYEEGKQSYDY